VLLPGDELKVKVRHVGMRDGNIVVKIETVNDRGEKVLEGSAEVVQATTVYVFTGQGSQEAGMGMDLYNSSPAARAVWDGADAHLLAVYGFSIIEIVMDNPKEKTIHFGGIKGQAIRQEYLSCKNRYTSFPELPSKTQRAPPFSPPIDITKRKRKSGGG
jgi:fatty acid synthase subunit alpha